MQKEIKKGITHFLRGKDRLRKHNEVRNFCVHQERLCYALTTHNSLILVTEVNTPANLSGHSCNYPL